MDPRSEVLLRQPQLFQGALLLAGLPADELMQALPQATGWSWHAGDFEYLQQRFGERVTLGCEPSGQAFAGAVLFLPKSRELTEYLLQALASHLHGKLLYLVGEKRGGIERAAKQLQAFGKPIKLDSARHCQLWQVKVVQAVENPDLVAQARHYPLSGLEIISLPGVFSHGRLDRGTALLLQHLDRLPDGHLLDFGCGAGVVGATLARRYPDSHITLLDVDAFAVASSRLTLAANRIENAEVILGNGIDAAPHHLSAVISNPPFHQGVHTHYAATEHMLREAAAHLRRGGVLRLVANSFLKYPPLIENHVGACTTLAEADGFRIYDSVTH